MKDKKLLKTIYYFLSLACYIVSILFFTKSESNGMGILWLLIGSALLSFANIIGVKSKDESK